MHNCAECGKSVATRGGIELHQQLVHSLTAPAPAMADGVYGKTPIVSPYSVVRPRRPARPDRNPRVAAVLVVLVLVAAIAGAVHVRSARRSAGAAAAGAAAHAAPAAPDAKAAQAAAQLAEARQQYVSWSAQTIAESDAMNGRLRTIFDGRHSAREQQQALAQAAQVMRDHSRRLRAIPFPDAVRPKVNAVLEDDAHIADAIEHSTISSPYAERRPADLVALRVALGLPPKG